MPKKSSLAGLGLVLFSPGLEPFGLSRIVDFQNLDELETTKYEKNHIVTG